jgi:hypothetical protein
MASLGEHFQKNIVCVLAFISKYPILKTQLGAFETKFNIYGVKSGLYEASNKKVKVPSVSARLPNGSGHFRGSRGTYFGGHSVPWGIITLHINHSLWPPIYSLRFALKVSSGYLMICRTVVEFVLVQQVTCKLGKERWKLS